MKREVAILAMAAVMAFSAAGCRKGSEGDKVENSATTAPVENISQNYVTLGDYKGLNIEKKIYTITSEDVENEIKSALDSYADYKEIKNRGAKKGDVITVDYKGTVNGKALDNASDEGYDFEIGTNEFGKEFDEGLIGMKTGDKKTITVKFDKDYEDSSWAGKTIDFQVKATELNEKILPKYNDKFVKRVREEEGGDFQNKKEYEAAIKEQLETDCKEDSNYEAGCDALDQTIANAEINGYPEDLYNSCYEAVKGEYESYSDYFNIKKDEIYDFFEVTEDDLKEEAMDMVNRKLVVNAVASAEGIAVSDEDYNSSVDSYAEEFGCESRQELEESYTVEAIKEEMLERKVMQFLVDHANATEVEASLYDEEE